MASYVALHAKADQNNTSSATDRILRWIETGKHTFKTDYAEIQAVRSTVESEEVPDSAVRKAITTLSEHMVEASSDGHLSYSTDKSLADLNS
jgi:hypothetical protein